MVRKSIHPEAVNGIKTLFAVNDLAWSFYNANPLNPPKRNMSPPEITLLLSNLKEQKVEFMIIGGVAMAFHGYARATGDINVWIKNSQEIMINLKKALVLTGFPEARALRTTSQLVPGMTVFNMLESDFKVDLMHYLKLFKETDFDACYHRATAFEYNKIQVKVLNAQDMLNEKATVNRPKDLGDIEFLTDKLKVLKPKGKGKGL